MCYGAAEVLTLWLEPSASELSDLRCLSGLSRGSMVSEWILISYGCSVGATQLGLLSWGCSVGAAHLRLVNRSGATHEAPP